MKRKRMRYKIENMRAMFLSKIRARQLLEEHPEIAQKWKNGEHLDDLAEEYCRGDSLSVGINTVGYALKELIPDEERRRIAKKHMIDALRESARDRGKRDYIMHRGIWHPKNAAKLAEGRKKGGYISGTAVGKRNYEAGIGIAALTKEDLHRIGQKAAQARGEVPFEGETRKTDFGEINEKDYIISLKMLEELSWLEITREVNRVFGNKRKLETIRTIYNQTWKGQIERAMAEV